MAKKSPAKKRVEIVRARRLGVGSALAEVQQCFSSPESRGAFNEWRNQPLTLMFVDALRELGVNPPAAYLETESIPVQYGVSSGLALAAGVLDDPSVLFPSLFTGVTPGSPATMLEADYATE